MAKETLVTSARWQFGAQLGCCGIGTVARLRANYPTDTRIAKDISEWQSQKSAMVIQGLGEHDVLATRIRMAQRTPWDIVSPVNPTYSLPTHYFTGTAIPVSIQFSAILEKMIQSDNYGIYFMSDNVAGTGDQHDGAFTTRAFAEWLRAENLGTLQTTGPIQSRRTGHDIQGWMVTLHFRNSRVRVKRARAQYREIIKEWNSNEHVKSTGEAGIKLHERERAELANFFSQGWAE